LTCAVNPEVDEGPIWEEPGGQIRRRVVVVGGGPAGMEAARVAARRHAVVVVEAGHELGGQVAAATAMSVRGELRSLLDWHVRQLTEAGVEVRLGTRATIEMILGLKPDVVVVATGSSPQVPDIATTGSPVVSSQAVMTNSVQLDPAAGALLLIDDEHGMEALSTALEMLARGFAVHLVNRRLSPGAEVAPQSITIFLTKLRRGGVEFHLGAAVERVEDRTVVLRDVFTGELRAGPDVQAVAFVGPRRAEGGDLVAALENASIAHVVIGDAYAPRRLHQAFREGALAGRRLGIAEVDDRIARMPPWGDGRDVDSAVDAGS
jgi:NADPH-dependent 2,4-dienoyl-CoA reductase/sulfur reductase-like enzyme